MNARYPIPTAALDDRLFFAGTAGAGKTYNAMAAVERLLAHKARVVIPDPLSVWWGLRLDADGKTASGHDVVIFGGPHGDLPLTEHAGALIGDTVAGMKESCIIDLSELGTKAAERRFMLAFLTALYKHASGEPVHVVFDEADMWSPQRLLDKDGDAAKLLGMMETVVRRGRVRGFIPWLISQRPAVISKDVLSQVDGLIAFKLTSSQDRDAIGDWVEGQADKQQWKNIWAQLPTMERGQGVVWLPARGILATAQFPPKVTFDSSRTPKRGECARATAALKPLDLGKLKERLARVEAETKANDPRALRAEIVSLQNKLKNIPKNIPVDQVCLEAAERRGFEQAERKLRREAERYAQDTIVTAMDALDALIAPIGVRLKEQIAAAKKQRAALNVEFTAAARASPAIIAARPARPQSEPNGGGNLDRPLQTIINAIRWWNVLGVEAPSHAQAAFVAGYSHKSGTWATYLSRLRSLGLIDGRGDLVLTKEGAAQAHDPQVPPTSEHRRAAVIEKLDTPLTRILSPILSAYPDGLSHQDAAERAGYSPQSGTWATYLSRLRSLDLIDGRGELRAQDWLFPMQEAA